MKNRDVNEFTRMAARQLLQRQDSDPGFDGVKGEQSAIVEGSFVLLTGAEVHVDQQLHPTSSTSRSSLSQAA